MPHAPLFAVLPQMERVAADELCPIDLLPLVRAMALGDAAALSALYDATIGKVTAVARAVLRNRDDADEVICDVYTQVWGTAQRFDATRGNVLGWLLRIARNRAIDVLRQRERHERTFATDEVPQDRAEEGVFSNPEALLNLFEAGRSVHSGLETLTPLRRQLLAMAFFRDLSHSEIAAETGLPVGTVKSQIRRALGTLRHAIEG